VLCWSLRSDASVPTSPGCEDAVDAPRLGRLPVGHPTRRLHLSVWPSAPNGRGLDADPAQAHATIQTDTVRVTVRYRLPEE